MLFAVHVWLQAYRLVGSALLIFTVDDLKAFANFHLNPAGTAAEAIVRQNRTELAD